MAIHHSVQKHTPGRFILSIHHCNRVIIIIQVVNLRESPISTEPSATQQIYRF